MKPLVTPSVMSRIEKHTIEVLGIPQEVLMDNAGRAVAHTVILLGNNRCMKSVVVVCGPGNNGGDGFACARYLHEWGMRVRIVHGIPIENYQGGAGVFARAAIESGVVCHSTLDAARLCADDIVVDALFGTGFHRASSEKYTRWIDIVNQAGSPVVVAVDIPSGICGASGRVFGSHIQATHTVALQHEKCGTSIAPGVACAGQVATADIGISSAGLKEASVRCFSYEQSDVPLEVFSRNILHHKASRGRLLVVAGSVGKRGAGALCANAALACGTGLVTVAAGGIYDDEPLCVQSLMTANLDQKSIERVVEETRPAAIVLGPGMEVSSRGKGWLQAILDTQIPLVLDADGINQLDSLEDIANRESPVVLTPHEAELARMLGCSVSEVAANRLHCVTTAAQRVPGVVILLKGYDTLVTVALSHGCCATQVVRSGPPTLATAGTGDILAGMVGAFLAGSKDTHSDIASMASMAAWLHGYTAQLWHSRHGEEGLTAPGLLNYLPSAINALLGAPDNGTML